MSFSLKVANLTPEQIDFGYSAAHETLIALHVFSDCKHHPLHIPWVMQARKKISPVLKTEIEAFRIFYNRPIVPFWELQEDSAIRSFEIDLNELLQKPKEEYQQVVLEALDGPVAHQSEMAKKLLEVGVDRYPEFNQIVYELVENPEASRQRFANMLEEFWNRCLKEEWPTMEERFLNDIALRGRILMNEGVLPLLASLSDEIASIPGENRAVIRRKSKKEITFGTEDRLFLAPTYFAWPHLFVSTHRQLGINYSISENQLEAAQPIPPEDLLQIFRALGDFTRLQIIRYLTQQPRSTRELSTLIGITEGAISKHLKILRDANLITASRQSYYVFYQLNKKTLNNFPHGLEKFLGNFRGLSPGTFPR
ncbi:ArsR/SmtB family transcription factor [Neobacillus sp. Marseille-QA0830]